MKALILLLPLAACAPVAGKPPIARPIVQGAPLLAAGVAANPKLATFARAMTAAGLAQTLAGPGPYTLFAPTEEAFARMAPGTASALLKPANRDALAKLVQLHLVAGRLTPAQLAARVKAGGGRASLSTVAGEVLALGVTDGVLSLTDRGGNKSYIEVSDAAFANGVLHVVNGVLVPRLE